jgi:nicotinamide riboside transporter PnuC
MDYTWFITLASVIGTVANVYQKRWCFFVWLCTNSLWMIIDFRIGLYAQAALFCVYVLLAVWGLIQWRG